jgi:hypothetical protein
MLCTHRLSPNARVLKDSPRQSVLTSHQAEAIVNIAGLSNGDRIFFAGAADMVIEEAVKQCGARLIAGKLKPWPLGGRHSADVALCFLGQGGTQDTPQVLRMIHHCLRPGGRVVIWTPPNNSPHPANFSDHFKTVTQNAGFTSMIVGQLPGEEGWGILVATGVRF